MLNQSTNSFQVITDLVAYLNGDERLLKLARGWRRKVLFVIDDEQCLVEVGADQVEVSRGLEPGATSDISFTMDQVTLLQIVHEEITPITAKMTGRIRSTGSLIDILRFVSILSNTVKVYNREGGTKQ